ncbi:MAG: hypothetical protein AMJ88_05165 [Anaerolineae bacterium SM23_ 63]|nr:MAG: hypothetical protein AMJ88_05165 [Anaerolineae bacterium SM23_ 63]HEY46435.1 hypothetical protein [Anaerolineae bacterium]
MEPVRIDLLILALNVILIALILTAPLLVGLLIIRVLRKWMAEDRKAFEDDIRSKLGEIAKIYAEVKKELAELR